MCCFVHFLTPIPLSPEPQERWHSRGQRFDPAYLHQMVRSRTRKSLENTAFSRLFTFCAELLHFAELLVPELVPEWPCHAMDALSRYPERGGYPAKDPAYFLWSDKTLHSLLSLFHVTQKGQLQCLNT